VTGVVNAEKGAMIPVVDEEATAGPHYWERNALAWHVLTVVVLIATSVFVALDDRLPQNSRFLVLSLLVAMAIWYLVAGIEGVVSHLRGWPYIIGVTALFSGAMLISQNVQPLLVALVTHCFVVLAFWQATIGVTLLFLAVPVTITLHDPTLETFLRTLNAVSLPWVGSVLLGGFIAGVITQSERRAGLIEELQRTREALAAERHRAGVRQERERLAADIHDTLAQGLASIVLLTQVAQRQLPQESTPARTTLELIERTARENLAEARALVEALTPPDLRETTVEEALHRLAARHIEQSGPTVRVEVADNLPPRASHVEVVLLRAAQEGLTNVRKHASATEVRIGLSYKDGYFELVIADDGVGFDPSVCDGGYGLRGMRNRVEAAGGQLTVSSAPGQGTTLCIRLPGEDQ